jgi:hypothetical protein
MAGVRGTILTIAFFGLTDVSHDMLVTPTRSAMNDVFDAESSERWCAISSGIGQLLGRVTAAMLPSRYAFFVTAVVMAMGTAVQFTARGNPSGALLDAATSPEPVRHHMPAGFIMIWMLQCVGWFTICNFVFYFTSVWAEQTGTLPGTTDFNEAIRMASVLLLGSSATFIATGFILPRIVRVFQNEMNACIFALFVFAAVLFLFGRVASPTCIGAGVVFGFPLAYQIIVNSPFAWLENQPDFEDAVRGRLTGWLNTSLAFAQAASSLISGPAVAMAGGRLTFVYELTAVVDVVVALVALLYLRCRCWREEARSTEVSTCPNLS